VAAPREAPTVDDAARAVVERCLAVAPSEDVLVVCDPQAEDLGRRLLEAALHARADAVMAVLPANPARGTEPPPTVAAALATCDVFIAPCTPSLSHTTARKTASDRGARGASMPNVTADVLARLMAADLDALGRRCAAMTHLLTDAESAHLTCPRGTDLRIDLAGRAGISDDGDLRSPGAFGNLPCGESYVAPAGGEGRAIVGSIDGLGLQTEPVELIVEGGRLTRASGPAGARLVRALTVHGDRGRNLAELGVGTNERATLTGNLAEDEKMLGTVHVAFGASAAIGGTVAVPVHIDAVILEPTLAIGGALVLDRGRVALQAP
jgi:leucyl aminopeptidase (aminopeptidase T)